MLRRTAPITLLIAMAAGSLVSTGCGVTHFGPSLGIFCFPIPVSPYFQKKKEDDFWNHERYSRAPILGPIESGEEPLALDTPSDDEVMRALERAQPVQGGIPLLWERNRNNVRIVKCKIADYVDPPRVYPMVGPAQQHHAHYKCTIYYEDVRRIGWPLPHTLRDEDSREVIYIDHNHLHMVGNVDTGACSPYGGGPEMAMAAASMPPAVHASMTPPQLPPQAAAEAAGTAAPPPPPIVPPQGP